MTSKADRELLMSRLNDIDNYDHEEWVDLRRHTYRTCRSLWSKDMDIFKHNIKTNCAEQLGFDKKVILH
jgi:hypothetical protein